MADDARLICASGELRKALQLAQLSLIDADNPDQHAASFSGKDRKVVDFLVEEIVSKQPAEIRDFLALTAGFDRFCAPLCDSARGQVRQS